MATIAEAVAAEDASLLVSLLSSLDPVPSPTLDPTETSLSSAALHLLLALDSPHRPAAAANIARATLHPCLFGAPRGASATLPSTAELAPRLDEGLAELAGFWNASVDAPFRAKTPAGLPVAILSARKATETARRRAAAARAQAGLARSAAEAMRVAAAREAVVAGEHDVAERAGARSAGNAAAAKAVARGNAVSAKLGLLRAETAQALYTPTSVRALRAAAAELAQRAAGLEPDAAAVQTRLAALREAEEDPEFARIVAEYAAVRKDLAEKQWSLQELGAP